MDSGYTKIVGNSYAFVAIKGDGHSLKAWPDSRLVGRISNDLMLKILMP